MPTVESITFNYRRRRMLLAFAAGVIMMLLGAAGGVGSVVVFRPFALPIMIALAAGGFSIIRRYRAAWGAGGRAWCIDARGLSHESASPAMCFIIAWEDWIGTAIVPSAGRPQRLLAYLRSSPTAFGRPAVITLPLTHFDPAPLADIRDRFAALAPPEHGFGPEEKLVRGQWKTEIGPALGVAIAAMLALPSYFFPDQPWWPGVITPMLVYVAYVVLRHRRLTDPVRDYPLLFWTAETLYVPAHPLGAVGFDGINRGFQRLVLTYLYFTEPLDRVRAGRGSSGKFTWLNFVAAGDGRQRFVAEMTRRGLWGKGRRHKAAKD